jgi:transposase
MATTSYLYHSLGLHGYRHMNTEYKDGRIYHHVEQNLHNRRCAGCGSRWHDLVMAGAFERKFIALPVGRRKQYVVLHGHEQECKRCGKTLREPIPFAKGKRRHLKVFARYVIELCALMTILHVALLLGVGWDLVKAIHKEDMGKRLKRRKLWRVRYIAVDEFALRKGHRYMTIVLDLETGEILYAHEGKDAEALIPFLRQLKRRAVDLRAVAIDMSQAYINAVREVFSDKLDIVHDPYHVVALVNQAIDETRRDLYRDLEGQERGVLKGTRFLLLKSLEKLSSNALERLMLLMEVNEPLYRAYLLKEDLRMFWNMANRDEGEKFLDAWISEARGTGLKHFVKLATTLDVHREGLLAYFEHRISTGPLEGLNNKVKVMKRMAYGYRDIAYFKMRLYFIHESKWALVG